MSHLLDDLMFPALLGGALIGFGATMSWVLSGRHIGFAKCIPTFEELSEPAAWWRMLIFVGLPIGGFVAYQLGSRIYGVVSSGASTAPLLIFGAGILAGAGLRLMKGCLVGHVVCGLARQSPRSALSMATIFAAAFATGLMISQVMP